MSVISNTTAQPFERALGQWHASWVPLTESMALIAGSAAHLKTLLQGLQVNPERMAANLDLNSDAYLSKNLERYFANNQNQIHPLIAQASQQAHKEHKGFVKTFLSLLAEQSISLNKDNELEALLSPLNYCTAADRQCQITIDTIKETTSGFKIYKQENN